MLRNNPRLLPLDRAVIRARNRLMPFLLLMYVIAFLDRANIAFAKPALQAHAGIFPRAYALGAGLFFLTYAAFEVPSNLILYRVGARPWMARIMISWGLVSVATLAVRGNLSFYLLRLLLGAAEAGFFPGILLYLTYWFPTRYRGQVLGIFYLGAPLAFIFGSPISSFLLHMRPLGSLQNWQWMFLVEGCLALGVGAWSYWYLDSRPGDAAWLPEEERAALAAATEEEEQNRRKHRPLDIFSMLRDRRVAHFTLIYFLIQVSIYGVVFYLPTEVAALLHHPAPLTVGFVAAVPWVCALVAAILLPRLADRLRRHRQIAAWTLLIATVASATFPLLPPAAGLIALCIAAAGFIAAQPLFWTLPANYLSARAAAAGFALINAIGNIGGFVAPNVKVWAELRFHSPTAGLYLLAALTLAGAALIAVVPDGVAPGELAAPEPTQS